MRSPEVVMTRAPLLALALLVATTGLAAAQQPTHAGRFELSGRYQPTLSRTSVVLDVTRDAAGRWAVTRTARVADRTITWTSTSATRSGQTLSVRYEVGG